MPKCVVSQYFPVWELRWAGSLLIAAPLSLQVLATLLVLTAVAELALAFVEDKEQKRVTGVQYTNPSLYIASWVRKGPVNALCVTRDRA